MHAFQNTILCCALLLAGPASAAEKAELTRYPSPKGDLVLLVEHHSDKPATVRLEGASGKLFLTLEADDSEKTAQIKEDSLLWDAKSDAVAFSVGNSRSLKAHAFIRSKEGVWKHIKLPEPGDGKTATYESYHSIPTKWDGNVLTLTVSGPHAEKPTKGAYAGSMTVAVDIEGGTAKKVEEKIEAGETKAAGE